MGILQGQEFDLIYTNSESGTQTHVARNSVTLGPNYSYTPDVGSSLTIEIQNPVATGSISYGSVVNPETRSLNTSYLVGTTKGEFNVNPMGGAAYSIPLELLPGANGLAPDLSLVYSTNGGPGIAGYGWEIAGLSVISRGPSTFYHDGFSKGVEFLTTDRLYLDGQRLVNTSSTYGARDATYQTENDIFTRITTMGGDLMTNRWFIAETRSGLKYEYGNASGSRQMVNLNRVKWYVSKISDLFGNYMTFSYLNDNNCVYPGEIRYGPNTITFYYKNKSEHDASFLKGTKIEQWLVLDKITVKYNSTVVKTYEFKYNYMTTYYNGYTVLNEIIEYGTGTQRYNSTAITYRAPANISFSQTTYNTTHGYVTYKSKLCAGDFNGDGKSDFFCLPDATKGATWTGYRVYAGDGNDNFSLLCSSTTPLVTMSQLKDIRSLDLNADGRDEILFETLSATSNFFYMLNNGTGFSAPQLINTQSPTYNYVGLSGKNYRWNLLMEDDNEITGDDYNGDGINDIFIHDGAGNWIVKSFGNGTGGITTTLNTLGSGNKTAFNGPIVSADFNGDGRIDIWAFTSYGNLTIFDFTGTDFGTIIYNQSLPYSVTLGDYNADGKADLFLYGSISGGVVNDMANWQIWLSTGTGFEQTSFPQKKSNLKDDYLRLGDFNGDGSTDLMVTSKNMSWTGTYFYISKNKGKDFYTNSLPSYPVASHNYFLADYNGDGNTDFMCTDGQSPWWNGYQVYKTTGNNALLAEKIGNGLGKLIKLTYVKLSQAPSTVYQRGTGAVFPVSDYQGPLHIVSSVQYDNGLSTMNTQSYYYEGARLHLQGKGFLCFLKAKTTDTSLGIESQTLSSYHPAYFYPQVLQSMSKRSGVTDTMSKVTNVWNQKVLDSAKKRIFPYIQQTVTQDKLTGHQVTTTFGGYDNYGNAGSVTKVFSGGHTETNTIAYNNTVSAAQWLLGRPTNTVIQYTGYDTTLSRTINRAFGTSHNNLTSETLYPGTALAIIHGYKYNSNGTLMRDSVFAAGIWRTSTFKYQSSDGIRLEKTTDALLHTKEYTYYNSGRLQTEKDYLNNTMTYQYNELGRQINQSSSSGNQLSTSYQWESTSGIARYRVIKTGNDGSETTTYFDELNREVKSNVKGFDGNVITTLTEYNAKGQLYRVSEPGITTSWNVYSYNNYGQLTDVARPSGRNSHWTYSGPNITETTGGKSSSKTFSSEGYLLSSADNGGTITYSYLPNGKVKSITAPGGIITRMKYDYADNQTKLMDPSAGTIIYSYNAFGELTGQTSSRPNQNTTITYERDGRIKQKTTPEGTSSYFYNHNKQLKRVNSTTGVNRIFRYDAKGRIASVSDSIGNVKDSTIYAYDGLGRLSTITHPSGIVETRHYNGQGYQDYIHAGSNTLWKINSLNTRMQITSATYGNSLNLTNLIDDYGYTNVIKAQNGSSVLQDFEYNFNPVTGNLNWRKDRLTGRNNMQENFDYDHLDRLKRIYRGTSTLMNINYSADKGSITRKTDVGRFYYNASQVKPYAIMSMDSCSVISASMNNSFTYTSFEKVNTITEGIYQAAFSYNADNQRAKMVIKQNGNPFFTRWYMGGSYMKQDSSGVQKEYTYIGGSAYTAPVLAVTQGGTTKYYYLIRDYLGNVMNMVNQSYSKVKEYSYDAWGRMRDPSNWTVYGPGSEPWLYGGRGYTGHEHLPWFKLINMNGRMYDPLTGQFLSPDPFVQAPYYTQSFNRYTYCFNNPLKYSDPSGYFAIPDNFFMGGGGGIEGSSNSHDFRFYEPVSDIGLSSGTAWLCRTYTPYLASYKQNQYTFDPNVGYWMNGLGERMSPNDGLIYRYYQFDTKADHNIIIVTPEGTLETVAYKGEPMTVLQKQLVFDGPAPSGQGGNNFNTAWNILMGGAGTISDVVSNGFHNSIYWVQKNGIPRLTRNIGNNYLLLRSNRIVGETLEASKMVAKTVTKINITYSALDYVGTTVYNQALPTFGQGMDLFFTSVAAIPGAGWAVSGGYWIISAGSYAFTGKWMSEHMDNWVP